jgi:replicative DNA helicase
MTESERRLLGGLLLSAETAREVLPRLNAADFDGQASTLFIAMQRIVLADDAPLTAESLTAQIILAGIDVGEIFEGVGRLVEDIDQPPPIANWARVYSAALHSEAMQRKLAAWASR